MTPHPQVSGALLTYDPCAQLGIADEVLVSIVSASELLRPVQNISQKLVSSASACLADSRLDVRPSATVPVPRRLREIPVL